VARLARAVLAAPVVVAAPDADAVRARRPAVRMLQRASADRRDYAPGSS
jgi:hypothetical protein